MPGHQLLGAGARLSVALPAAQVEQTSEPVALVERYTRALLERLRKGGHAPRHVDVDLRLVPPRAIEIGVEGDVPGLEQVRFAQAAQDAIGASGLWAALDVDTEIRLRPRLMAANPAPAPEAAATSEPPLAQAVEEPRSD